MEGESLYYGLNALSNNMIMVDRKMLKNPNGLILGTPGSGKSFAAKREICNVILLTDDDIIICDPEAEYYPLVHALGGQVIHLSATSKDYVNPMDINLNYSDEENPLSLKSDFILSLCELIVGGKDGLKPVEKTLIDRCVRMVYQDYLNDPKPENMPVLGDLYDCLRTQDEKEAQYIATALEIYVTGSLSVFNHRTNVDLKNRFIVFDLSGLKDNLRITSMLIMMETVKGSIKANSGKKRWTHLYIDEFHELLGVEQVAGFILKLWKEIRKMSGILCGITQNLSDLLNNDYGGKLQAILSNTEYFALLSQSTLDKNKLMQFLPSISPAMFNFVDNADSGTGLLKMGTVTVPFDMRMSKECEIYRIVNTDGGSYGV